MRLILEHLPGDLRSGDAEDGGVLVAPTGYLLGSGRSRLEKATTGGHKEGAVTEMPDPNRPGDPSPDPDLPEGGPLPDNDPEGGDMTPETPGAGTPPDEGR